MSGSLQDLIESLHAKLDEEREIGIRRFNVLATAVHFLIKRDPDMPTQAHKDLLDLADAVDASTDKLIAEKKSGEDTLADIAAALTKTKAKIDAEVEAEDAAKAAEVEAPAPAAPAAAPGFAPVV